MSAEKPKEKSDSLQSSITETPFTMPKEKRFRLPFHKGDEGAKFRDSYQVEIEKNALWDTNTVNQFERKIDDDILPKIISSLPEEKRTPENAAKIRTDLYWALLKRIAPYASVPDAIKQDLAFAAEVTPSIAWQRDLFEKQRAEIVARQKALKTEKREASLKAAGEREKLRRSMTIDPLLVCNPNLGMNCSEATFDVKEKTVDAQLKKFLEGFNEGLLEIPLGELNPLQTYLLELVDLHAFEPIRKNLRLTAMPPLALKSDDILAKIRGTAEYLVNLSQNAAYAIIGIHVKTLFKTIAPLLVKLGGQPHEMHFAMEALFTAVKEFETGIVSFLQTPGEAGFRLGWRTGKVLTDIPSSDSEISLLFIEDVIEKTRPLSYVLIPICNLKVSIRA